MASTSHLLRSSLLLPLQPASFLTFRNQELSTVSPSYLGEDWLSVAGYQRPRQLQPLALLGHLRTLAGRTCTPPGQTTKSVTLIKSSLNSKYRYSHVAWSPPLLLDSIVLLGGWDHTAQLTAEIVPGFDMRSSLHLFFVAGGGSFRLHHSGYKACGIPDEGTIVMTGGLDHNNWVHNHVTR